MNGFLQWRKFRGGGAIAPPLLSNCQFVGNFHFIVSSENTRVIPIKQLLYQNFRQIDWNFC